MIRRLMTLLVAVLPLASWSLRPVRAQAPAASSSPPFFFVQLSDPQLGMFEADRGFAQETANFTFAIAAINRLRPAFVVITGDLVNNAGHAGERREYARLRATIARDIPVYEMPGNHDVENAPTPATVAAYRRLHGADHYAFTYRTLRGLVLDSTLIHTPDKAPAEAAAQQAWLEAELARAQSAHTPHIVIFQHHPWFLKAADEADDYFNIPLARREPLLRLFHARGVEMLVSGHYHRNAVARDGTIEAITTGPTGMPLGGAHSGLRIVLVSDAGITHRYFDFGELPTVVDPAKGFEDRQ